MKDEANMEEGEIATGMEWKSRQNKCKDEERRRGNRKTDDDEQITGKRRDEEERREEKRREKWREENRRKSTGGMQTVNPCEYNTGKKKYERKTVKQKVSRVQVFSNEDIYPRAANSQVSWAYSPS